MTHEPTISTLETFLLATMLRSSRDKDVQSLDIYSEDEDNTARAPLGEVNEASPESSVNGRATPGRLPVRQRYWKETHLWPARIFSVLCCIVIVSFIAVLISFLYIVLKGNLNTFISVSWNSSLEVPVCAIPKWHMDN